MNLFNRCLTAFSLFFIAHLCLAQNTVSGIVLDDEGLPLYGATVIIGDSNEGTVTNPQGAFELKTEKDIPGDASFPANKVRIGLNYDPKKKFDASINYQWDDGFTSNTPTFPGTIPAKSLVDVSLGFKLSDPLRFEVAAINLLNNRFRALPGFPRLGRTVTGRLVLNLK